MASSREADFVTEGRVLNWGWRYDLMGWVVDLLTHGKLTELRRTTAARARVGPGQAVLDVGCGTGALALAVQEQVGATGRVVGVDPGAQQIARARSKAARLGLPVEFRVGVIEQLPFADGSFDAVLNTIMLHHLPPDLKRRGLAEIARVLKPGGRVAVADFKADGEGRAAHRGSDGADPAGGLAAQLREAGFTQVEAEDLRIPWVPAHPRRLEIVSGVKAQALTSVSRASATRR